MNTYYINDNQFKKTNIYKEYLNNHKGVGYLKIKASSANEAVPIQGIKIAVTKTINNDKIVFFEGITNESGIINNIPLPTFKNNNDNLISPLYETYDILSLYEKDNLKQNYKANIFDGIYVVQNINIKPAMNMEDY